MICPDCGTTREQFLRTGLLGCPACYTVFRDEVFKTVRTVQGRSIHEGKTPAFNVGADMSFIFREENMKEESEQAMRNRNFAEAKLWTEKLKAVKAKRNA